MEFDENLHDQIDRYLNNKMSEEEAKQFEVKKNNDEKLLAELEMNAQMKEFLKDSPENKLRANLKKLSDEFVEEEEKEPIHIQRNTTNFSLIFKVAAAIIIAGMLWWLYANSSNSTPNKTPEIVKTPEDIKSDENQQEDRLDLIDDSKNEDIANEDVPIKNEEIEIPQEAPDKKLPPKNKKRTLPKYIAADFEVNSNLEFLIDNNLRSNDLRIELTRKIGNVSLSSPKDIVTFQLGGKILTKQDIYKKELKVHLFSNKKSDYEDFLPINTAPLEVKSDLSFDFQNNINLKPGLYYYIIEDEVEKVHLVGKFEVR